MTFNSNYLKLRSSITSCKQITRTMTNCHPIALLAPQPRLPRFCRETPSIRTERPARSGSRPRDVRGHVGFHGSLQEHGMVRQASTFREVLASAGVAFDVRALKRRVGVNRRGEETVGWARRWKTTPIRSPHLQRIGSRGRGPGARHIRQKEVLGGPVCFLLHGT